MVDLATRCMPISKCSERAKINLEFSRLPLFFAQCSARIRATGCAILRNGVRESGVHIRNRRIYKNLEEEPYAAAAAARLNSVAAGRGSSSSEILRSGHSKDGEVPR